MSGLNEMGEPNLTDTEIYYIVTFLDEALKVPLIQTVRFVEIKRMDGGDAYAYFIYYEPAGKESLFKLHMRDIETLVLTRARLAILLGAE